MNKEFILCAAIYINDGLIVSSFEDIKEDFQKRLAILDIKEKKDKLDKMKQKLDSIASEDLKRQKILKEIEEDFNSDFS